MRIQSKTKKAFTLIEMMVFIFIFSVTALTFYRAFTSGSQVMSNAKSRRDALAIANEKMEIIHNLDYEKVGTLTGVVHGDLPDDETVTQDNRTFWVHTVVLYYDDPFDGTEEAGTDSKPNDYKQIKIQVYWEQNNKAKSVTLDGSIVPPGIESIYTGGILAIHVLDNSGVGIPNANVNVSNSAVSPAVNVNLNTDSEGNIFLIEAQPSSQSYHISVSKDGYFPVQTYSPYPTSTVDPVNVNASVDAGHINDKSIATDKLASFTITTKSPLGDIIPNINYSLIGGREIAVTHETSPTPVYAYNNQSLTTDDQGKTSFSEMSSGQYIFALGNDSSTNYKFLWMDPFKASNNQFDVAPASAIQETAVLADTNVDSLLVSVVDSLDSSPFPNANVELKDPNSTYDVTLQTNNFGQAYFPDSSGPLSNISYELKVTAPGYSDVQQNVNVNKLTEAKVTLVAN